MIGASGGIGRGFIEHLATSDRVSHIHAFSRSVHDFDHDKVISEHLDLTDEDSIKYAAKSIDGELDLVIIASGLLHRDDDIQPEKSLRDLNLKQFHDVFAINTFGPALVAKHFTPLLPRDRRSVFAALSARVSSISDNGLGGWYAYRAAKTALNMVIKNTAIEVARKNKETAIIGLHPGTVETALSEPFRGNVAQKRLFTPEQSSAYMLEVINNVTPSQSGELLAYDGQIIEP